jgi:hypothetical protein
MAAVSTIIAGAALATTVYSVSEQSKQAKKSARAQENLQNEERARNTGQQIAERRQQIREERVKRARVMQASQNTGVAGGSGEAGALSSLSTQLGSNVGFNQSMIQSGERMSIFAQQAATAQYKGQQAALLGSFANSAASFSGSIFGTTPQPTNTTTLGGGG